MKILKSSKIQVQYINISVSLKTRKQEIQNSLIKRNKLKLQNLTSQKSARITSKTLAKNWISIEYKTFKTVGKRHKMIDEVKFQTMALYEKNCYLLAINTDR